MKYCYLCTGIHLAQFGIRKRPFGRGKSSTYSSIPLIIPISTTPQQETPKLISSASSTRRNQTTAKSPRPDRRTPPGHWRFSAAAPSPFARPSRSCRSHHRWRPPATGRLNHRNSRVSKLLFLVTTKKSTQLGTIGKESR